MKSKLPIRIAGITLTLLLASVAHAQADDLVCNQCVNTSDIANDAVGSAKLKADSVTSDKIGAGEIATADIKAGAVTSDKIGTGEVKTADIADLAISASKLKAGSVTQPKLDPTLLDALHVKFASVTGSTFVELTGGGGCTNYPHASVTIEVPGPGTVKVDAQVVVGIVGHTNGIEDSINVYVGAAPDDCTGSFGLWSIRAGEPTHSDNQYQTVPVSNTFTVSDAGSYTYYLNGELSVRAAFGGVGAASVQALYFPDF